MTVGHALAIATLGFGLVAYGRRSQDRFWSIGGLAFLTVLAAVVAGRGIDPLLLRGPNDALVLAGEWIWAAFFVIEGLGLPRSIATRVGLGLRSREWEFDRRLTNERSGFIDRAGRAFSRPSPDQRSTREVNDRLARVRALRPPDPDWAALRDELAVVDGRYLELMTEGAEPQARADLPDEYQPIFDRWTALRVRYRAKAADMTPTPLSRFVRGAAFPIASGMGAVMVGLGILRVVGGRPAAMDEPLFWPGVICLALGCVALLSIWQPLGRRLFR